MTNDNPKTTATIGCVRADRKWRPEWDAEMIRDWNQPTTIGEFARRFGVNHSTARKHAIKLGLWETTATMKEHP